LNPPPGALFTAVVAGNEDEWFLLATSGGYGFLTPLKEFFTKNRTGKTLLTVPPHAAVLAPMRIQNPDTDTIAVVTLQGRLLVFPATEVPVLNKGKGNKLIQIAGEELANGTDRIVALTGLPAGASLRLHCAKRYLTLSAADLAAYQAARGRRGNHLPRGFQRVDRVEIPA
jgi:topoisomerase-4 subunit A